MTMLDVPELLSFLSSPFANATGWALLHFLWQGALIALVLRGSLYLLSDRKPSVQYVACCLALAGLLILPVATGGLFFVEASPGGGADVPGLAADAAVSSQIDSGTWDSFRAEHLGLALRPMLPWIVLGWGLGVLVCMGRFARGAWRARQLRKAGSSVSDQWQQQLAALADRIGLDSSVAFRESRRVSVPTVAGWWRPVLLVPVGFLSGLPPRQVEAVLLHELAHVRRHDALVARLQAVCETLFFFHPATWWVSGRVRQFREACCDSVVVESGVERANYARALLALAEQVRGTAPSIERAAANDGHLLARVRRILVPPESPPFPTRALSTGVTLLLLAGLPFGLAAVTAQQPMSATSVSRTMPSASSGPTASYVLKPDSSGHATLISTSTSDTGSSRPQPGHPSRERRGSVKEPEAKTEPSGEGTVQKPSRIELDNLRRSVRKNLDLEQIKQRLDQPISTDRLRKALRAKVRRDRPDDRVGTPFGGERLKRVVRKEVTDSLSRTLRKKLSAENIEQTVRIRVEFGTPPPPTGQPNGEPSETTQPFPMPEEPALTAGPGSTVRPDSLFSQALSESLSNTVLVLGADATVVKPGDSDTNSSIRRPTS